MADILAGGAVEIRSLQSGTHGTGSSRVGGRSRSSVVATVHAPSLSGSVAVGK